MALCLFVCVVILQIPGSLQVDSDEVKVPTTLPAPLKCAHGSKACDDQTDCVRYSNVCDGEDDCRDGSDEFECSTECTQGQFQCVHGKKCIELSERCDKVAQCQDLSDEMGCIKKLDDCVHHCDNGKLCLPHYLLCNGERDCIDGTDEFNCDDSDEVKVSTTSPAKAEGWQSDVNVPTTLPAPAKCAHGTWACNDLTECIHYNYVCDGDPDCMDGSDEFECSTECKEGQFQCAHGKKCIERSAVCDGTAQCQDRSDEMGCIKKLDNCVHHCDNGSLCLPHNLLCDGERDCVDGTDEFNCAEEGCGGEFHCSSGQCVSESLHCDGHPDCRDRSDEESCTKLPGCINKSNCTECVQQEWLCDGYQDCKDGIDEKNCRVDQLKCEEFQWPCSSKTQCVPKAWRCDEMKDCDDASDETGCGVACPPHQFQCGSMECLDVALVCNGMTDCADGSDEEGDCQTKCPAKHLCHQDCHSMPKGTKCWCRSGYTPHVDAVSCIDIDECGQPGICSHTCINTMGSFKCKCSRGYSLEADRRSCKNHTDEPYLLASVQSQLFLFGLRTSSLDVLPSSAKKAILSVDYDWKDQKVFWVSLDSGSIEWSSLFHKTAGTLIRDVHAECISVDWVGRNLYWIDGVNNLIGAIRLTTDVTNDYSVILDEDLNQPRSLALLPQKGIMFWSEMNEAIIERAGMDGSQRKKVVVAGHKFKSPMDVAVDAIGNRIYWTDQELNCIGSATLDGEDIQILQMETSSPFSLAVFKDMLYWSDAKKSSIQGAHKLTGKGRKVVFKRPGQPFVLKIIHPLLQAVTESPCEKQRCTHLCVLAPGPKAVCKCPSGLVLSENGLKCLSPTSPSAFLLLMSRSTVTQIYLQARKSQPLKAWPEHLTLQLPNFNEATTFDYSVKRQTLYMPDVGQASVGLFKLKETGLDSLCQALTLQEDLITAMALDWVTLNVYWSSHKQPRLQVTSADGRYTAILIKDIGSLHSIALHPPSGRVCFAYREDQFLVECAHMDGARKSLMWKKAVRPTALVFNSRGDVIYWAVNSAGVIASIGIDGSGFKEFKTGDGLSAFALSDNVLLWMTVNDTSKVSYRNVKKETQTLWFEVNTSVVSMKAYSELSQKGTNPCATENGGCRHLCLPVPEGRTCKCAHDHTSFNDTQCAPAQSCLSGLRPCLNKTTCHLTEKFCNGHPDCPDHSDELNCVPPMFPCFKNKIKSMAEAPSTTAPSMASPSMAASSPTVPSTAAPSPSGGSDVTIPDMPVGNLDAQPCGETQCGGKGECVDVNGKPTCVCSLWYGGDSCQDPLTKGPLMYGAVGLCAAVIVIAVLIVVIKKKTASTRRAIPEVTETSMTDLEKHGETTSTQSKPDNVLEELVPSVD